MTNCTIPLPVLPHAPPALESVALPGSRPGVLVCGVPSTRVPGAACRAGGAHVAELPPPRHTILCNIAQQFQCYLDLPPDGLVDTVTIPRAHLRRWLELVHSAVLLLDAPLAAARGVVQWRWGGWLRARRARRLGTPVTTLGSEGSLLFPIRNDDDHA